MIIFKCKMCGGDLNITEGATVCECEYCGTSQTVPAVDNEKKMNLFNRANRLRFNNEFDSAAGVFQNIVSEFPEESEAYWGLCLCKYGIEYVDDPATGKKIPTCHRTSYESIFDDSNFEMALEYADSIAKRVYRDEAKEIDRIQKSILDIAKNEAPYDIFICYKETSESGERTKDSVLAQDMYDALTEKGYKVFFARITLEDKLGEEYEPYIFSALNSAKIMLAVGTDYDYFNAVWVKNEWSRFLDLMKKDKSKVLIPCYADIDAYDMPKEFKNLQGQDMGKIGFMQDLLRGIGKILKTKEEKSVVTQIVTGGSATTDSLLERVFMYLDDENWKSADDYCEKILDIEPKHAKAYFGKFMAAYKIRNEKKITEAVERAFISENKDFFSDENIKKAARFADDDFNKQLSELNKAALYLHAYNYEKSARTDDEFLVVADLYSKVKGYSDSDNKVKEYKEKVYSHACERMKRAGKDEDYKAVGKWFAKLGDYKDSEIKAEECLTYSKESVYKEASDIMNRAESKNDFKEAADLFNKIKGYKDTNKLLGICNNKISEIENEEKERIRVENEKRIQAEIAEKKRKRKIMGITVAGIAAVAAVISIVNNVIIPEVNYSKASELIEQKKYANAVEILTDLDGYKDSKELIKSCNNEILKLKYEDSYQNALKLKDEGDYVNAIKQFSDMKSYRDSATKIVEIKELMYKNAVDLCDNYEFKKAKEIFTQLNDYKNSSELAEACDKKIVQYESIDKKYNEALNEINEEHYRSAIKTLEELGDYKDSQSRLENVKEQIYQEAQSLYNNGEYSAANGKFSLLGNYKDSKDMIAKCNNSVDEEKARKESEKKYNEAVNLYNDGLYNSALSAFEELGDYEDSKEWVEKCKVKDKENSGSYKYLYKELLMEKLEEYSSVACFDLYDLDNDGTPELIFKIYGYIEIYTISDGKPTLIYNGDFGKSVYLANTNGEYFIICSDVSVAFYGSYSAYYIFQKREASIEEIVSLEILYPYTEGEDILEYYYCDDNEISKDEFDSSLKKFGYVDDDSGLLETSFTKEEIEKKLG